MYSFHLSYLKCKDMLHLLINSLRFKSTSVEKEKNRKDYVINMDSLTLTPTMMTQLFAELNNEPGYISGSISYQRRL